MLIEKMSVTEESTSTTSDINTSTSDVVYEYPLNVNEYGEQLKLNGSNKDMYLAVAYLFQPTSGLSEFNLESWLLEDKIGMLDNSVELNAEMQALTRVLQEGGLSTITSVSAVRDTDESGTYLLSFVTTSGDTFYIDPFVAAALR